MASVPVQLRLLACQMREDADMVIDLEKAAVFRGSDFIAVSWKKLHQICRHVHVRARDVNPVVLATIGRLHQLLHFRIRGTQPEILNVVKNPMINKIESNRPGLIVMHPGDSHGMVRQHFTFQILSNTDLRQVGFA